MYSFKQIKKAGLIVFAIIMCSSATFAANETQLDSSFVFTNGNSNKTHEEQDMEQQTEYADEKRTEVKDTWHEENGRWWYGSSNSDYVKNCWKIIDNNTYYFGNDGYIAQGPTKIDNAYYNFDVLGPLKTAPLVVGNVVFPVKETGEIENFDDAQFANYQLVQATLALQAAQAQQQAAMQMLQAPTQQQPIAPQGNLASCTTPEAIAAYFNYDGDSLRASRQTVINAGHTPAEYKAAVTICNNIQQTAYIQKREAEKAQREAQRAAERAASELDTARRNAQAAAEQAAAIDKPVRRVAELTPEQRAYNEAASEGWRTAEQRFEKGRKEEAEYVWKAENNIDGYSYISGRLCKNGVPYKI